MSLLSNEEKEFDLLCEEFNFVKELDQILQTLEAANERLYIIFEINDTVIQTRLSIFDAGISDILRLKGELDNEMITLEQNKIEDRLLAEMRKISISKTTYTKARKMLARLSVNLSNLIAQYDRESQNMHEAAPNRLQEIHVKIIALRGQYFELHKFLVDEIDAHKTKG